MSDVLGIKPEKATRQPVVIYDKEGNPVPAGLTVGKYVDELEKEHYLAIAVDEEGKLKFAQKIELQFEGDITIGETIELSGYTGDDPLPCAVVEMAEGVFDELTDWIEEQGFATEDTLTAVKDAVEALAGEEGVLDQLEELNETEFATEPTLEKVRELLEILTGVQEELDNGDNNGGDNGDGGDEGEGEEAAKGLIQETNDLLTLLGIALEDIKDNQFSEEQLAPILEGLALETTLSAAKTALTTLVNRKLATESSLVAVKSDLNSVNAALVIANKNISDIENILEVEMGRIKGYVGLDAKQEPEYAPIKTDAEGRLYLASAVTVDMENAVVDLGGLTLQAKDAGGNPVDLIVDGDKNLKIVQPGLAAEIADIKSDIADLKEMFEEGQAKIDIEDLESDIAALKEMFDEGQAKIDVEDLESDIADMKTDILAIKTAMTDGTQKVGLSGTIAALYSMSLSDRPYYGDITEPTIFFLMNANMDTWWTDGTEDWEAI